VVPRDAHHREATTLWGEGGHLLVTTSHVMGETWTFLRRGASHQVGLRFLRIVESSLRVTIVRVDDATEREAWEWLRRHDERVYSFVDATSFAVMRRLGLIEARAFDGDFSAAGFVEVHP
jgi:predicted nucleic acid-binding protein